MIVIVRGKLLSIPITIIMTILIHIQDQQNIRTLLSISIRRDSDRESTREYKPIRTLNILDYHDAVRFLNISMLLGNIPQIGLMNQFIIMSSEMKYMSQIIIMNTIDQYIKYRIYYIFIRKWVYDIIYINLGRTRSTKLPQKHIKEAPIKKAAIKKAAIKKAVTKKAPVRKPVTEKYVPKALRKAKLPAAKLPAVIEAPKKPLVKKSKTAK